MPRIAIRLSVFLLCGILALTKAVAQPIPAGNVIANHNLAEVVELQRQAAHFIATQPAESTQTVMTVLRNYQTLQTKWMGADNVSFNRQQINADPLFARTALFESRESTPAGSIKFVRLNYRASISGHPLQELSGLLLLPATSHPKGMVLFFHSTISGKLNVPSLRFNDYKAQMLAAVFASNGYIVVAPDYIGLGQNYKMVHPYILYPELNVEDGQAMLIAARDYVVSKTNIKLTEPTRLYVSGYSEGASYALWFSRYYQSVPNFAHKLEKARIKLHKTVPIEGAYNLTGVMFPFLLNNQANDSQNKFNVASSWWGTLLKPSLLANVMIAYAFYNKKPIQQLLNSDFYTLRCSVLPQFSCDPLNVAMSDLERLSLTTQKTFYLVFKYFLAASFKSNGGVIYSPLFNSVMPLLADGAAEDHELLATAAKANILNWRSQNPITLISLASDSLVPEQNSADAYAGLVAAGSSQVKYIKFNNQILHTRSLFGQTVIDHVGFELYALLLALQEINQS